MPYQLQHSKFRFLLIPARKATSFWFMYIENILIFGECLRDNYFFYSSIIFQHEVVGEFWYRLNLVAEQPEPKCLPSIDSELGRCVLLMSMCFLNLLVTISVYK